DPSSPGSPQSAHRSLTTPSQHISSADELASPLPGGGGHAWAPPLLTYSAANAAVTTATVRSMSSSVCATERKAASNWEGGQYTPLSSTRVCQRPNRSRSERSASVQLRTGPS